MHESCPALFGFEGTIPSKYGAIAQLGEHLPCKQGVSGSNPLSSTKKELFIYEWFFCFEKNLYKKGLHFVCGRDILFLVAVKNGWTIKRTLKMRYGRSMTRLKMLAKRESSSSLVKLQSPGEVISK